MDKDTWGAGVLSGVVPAETLRNQQSVAGSAKLSLLFQRDLQNSACNQCRTQNVLAEASVSHFKGVCNCPYSLQKVSI